MSGLQFCPGSHDRLSQRRGNLLSLGRIGPLWRILIVNLKLKNPAALAALFVVSAAAQAQMPKVEMAVYVDANSNVLRRLDLQTGRYFGTIGQGKLESPRDLCIDNKKGIVYVSDYVGVKKFDVSTGRYLGIFRSTSVYGQPNDLAIEADGSVDVLQDDSATTYRVQRFNPTTGALVIQTAPRLRDFSALKSLTVDAAGNVEAWITKGTKGYAEKFNPSLGFVTSTLLQHVPRSPVRSRNGGYVYTFDDAYLHTEIYGGTGSGSESLRNSVNLFNRSAAEGALGVIYETYPADNLNIGNFQIEAYDTSFGVPTYIGKININIPADQSLTDMAVYVRF